MIFEKLALQGRTSIRKSTASSISSQLLRIRNENIRSSFKDFFDYEHRLEYVASVHNIDFINDSKAETINSTWYALEEMLKPTIWIVGGYDENNDYTKLYDVVKNKVKGIICIGVNNDKIKDYFKDIVKDIIEIPDMSNAVLKAFHLAESGDVVLLSPASKPDSIYVSFEKRGTKFKKAVRKL
jgi:UDP-N-acetylmuramoylalanine--D-glutamate ligase